MQEHANDLIEICKHLNLTNVTLVGHSVSAMISMLAQLSSPTLFSQMVMIGASPRYINDDHYLGGFTQEDLDTLYQTMKTNYYTWVSGFAPYVMKNEDQPSLAKEFATTLAAIRPDIALSVVRTIFQSDNRQYLPQLNTPTLLLNSHNDPAVPNEVGEYMHKHIRNSQLRFLDTEGHFPQMSAPQQVINAIQQFIAA